MEKLNPITQELLELGSTLGTFPTVNPYCVPPGYFDEFPLRMYTLASVPEIPAFLAGKANPFTAPAGYFDSLPAAILRKVQLAGNDELPGADNESPADELAVISPLLSGISKTNPFQVPVDYFTRLASDAVSGARAMDSVNEELENLSSLMSGLKGVNVYTVPDGYFEALPRLILQQVTGAGQVKPEASLSPEVPGQQDAIGKQGTPDTRVTFETQEIIEKQRTPDTQGNSQRQRSVDNKVTLDKQVTTVTGNAPAKVVTGNFRRRVLQYAAAAVVAVLLTTAGAYLIKRNDTSPQIVSTTGLKEKALQASDEEILNYLETIPVAIPDSLITSDHEIKADAILDMLADVSDEELQQYVQLQSDTKLLIN